MKTELLPVFDPQADSSQLQRAAEILRSGGLVAIPTETVYGLAANALDGQAVRRIFQAKGRPQDNPLIVHIASQREAQELVTALPEAFYKLAAAFWPGPLTMILPKNDKVPPETSGGLETVALRMPSHPVARRLIQLCGLPLAAPSANLSGSPSPTTARHCIDDLSGRVEAIILSDDCDVGVESTVISLVGRPRLLRPGAVTPEMLEAVIGPVEIDPAVTQQLAAGAKAASPGMKYKHYAPKAHVVLVEGDWAFFAHYVAAHARGGDWALVFDGEGESLPVPVLEYGGERCGQQQARRIFSALRQLDEKGAATVFARCPSKEGVGLAVYNRLVRAAGFDIVRKTGGVKTPLVLGLTGQTGAGKSTVSRYFSRRGAGVIDADALAREVVLPGSEGLAALVEAFSPDILTEEGQLNRKKLGELVFGDPEQLRRLNGVMNPRILLLAEEKIRQLGERHSILLLDAPTLLESGADRLCKAVICVVAPESLRQSRIMARDGLSQKVAKARMSAQHPDEFYTSRSRWVLTNDRDEAWLEQQAERVLLELAALGQGG